MAHRLLLASLVGTSGVSGLSFAGDLELMQMWKTTDTNNVSSTPELKSWLCSVRADCTQDELASFANAFQGGQHTKHPNQLPFVHGLLTDEGINQAIASYSALIPVCEEDPYTKKAWETVFPDDFGVRGPRRTYPWGINDIDADVVRGRGVGTNVYVLDTGIRITHGAFGGRAFAGVDVSSGTLVVCPQSSTTCADDQHGHGTHCAGTVGASTYGVADGATLWAMKVLDNNGDGLTSWSIDAEQWIYTYGVRPAVVSMSLGGFGNSPSEKISIDALVGDGVTVVVAAGNQNTDACNYNPSWIPSAITVGSYALGGAMSSFSNYGTCIDVWAPGTDILSTIHTSDTSLGVSSGTSMACPHVSGLAAIMYQENSGAETMTDAQRWALITARQRTGYVTGIPSNPPSVNLVALAPTPTPSPPTPPAPAPPAPPGGAQAVGDPHLQNVHGERFDLMKVGKHVMLNIPRGMSAENVLLRVQADAVRLGGHCADLYFQELNITGSWAEAKKVGGYHYVVSQRVAEAPEWIEFGSASRTVNVKVVHAHTQKGLKYLNFYVKNLGRVGFPVGGLLGEDDHIAASTPSAHCGREMTLLEMAQGAKGHGESASSFAEASFD